MSVLHPGISGRLWFGVGFFAVYTGLSISFLVDAVRRLQG
jgi:hypothetical protein